MRIPTAKEVAELVRKTGESPRKCYFWLVHELNKTTDESEHTEDTEEESQEQL